MNNRWTREEESKLLKLVADGKSYTELAGGFNRSENALEMRVKKIIYENIAAGKTPSKISELMNIDADKVMQYYYSYKDHVSRENNIGNINTVVNKMDNDNVQKGGEVHQPEKSDKIDKLKLQNEKLKLLLENYVLKHRLSKVMKSDKNIQNDILKALLDK